MVYTAYERIAVVVEEGVATIEFQRPAKHNALDTATMLDLGRAFDELQLDRDVDAVVITGAGDAAFSAGADIAEYAGPSSEHDPVQKDRQDIFYRIYRKPYDLHAPVIAAIDGYCMGGGLILALYCDLRIADNTAEFGMPTANIGQIPTGGATRRAVELVGEAKAKELAYTAGTIDAGHAERIGLVNRVVPPADLDGTVADIVAAIQATGGGAVTATKRAIHESVAAPDRETAREREAAIWWEQFATDERRGLVAAFLGDPDQE